MTDLDDAVARCRTHLAGGEAAEAWRVLAPVLAYPAEALGDDAVFRAAFAAFAEVAGAIAGEAFRARIDRVVADPDDVEGLSAAGYECYEQRLMGVAATLMARANRLAPGDPRIVAELVSALEGTMAYAAAALAIDASGLAERDPMLAYLSGFQRIMTGDVDGARRRLAQLDGVDDEPIPFVRASLAGMVARADRLVERGVALDERALTAWHAVIEGAVLTHESPHGHDEPMRGRYAFVQDSPGLMRHGLDRLAEVLAAAGVRRTRVVAAPDRASRILARAAAGRLGLPYAEWDGVAHGLVVVWDLDAVQDPAFWQAVHHHTADHTLFVHASRWTDPFPFAPDVTTLLYQQITHPYAGGAMRVVDGEVVRADPDERDEEALAREILDAPDPDDSASPIARVRAIAEALVDLPEPARPGLARTSGERYRQRAGSPVPSARFA